MCFFTHLRSIFSASILPVLLLSGLASCTGSTGETESVPTINVPAIVGQKQSSALTTISNAGLSKGNVTAVANNSVPMDDVISQTPSAGALVAAGTSVNLIVSAGPADINVPNIVGQTQNTAESQLTGLALSSGTITSSTSNSVVAGSIISQDPAAGTLVSAGTSVNMVVSLGAASISVPDVTGLLRATAESSITSANLTVGNITMSGSNSVNAGNVISQNPATGTLVASNSSVSLVISTGSTSVTVPDAVGQTKTAAQSMITSSGLAVGSTTNVYSDTIANNIVISTSPSAGMSALTNSTVDMVVSKGPQPASSAPVIAGCQLFPDDNLWNTAVDSLPVHSNSANYINSIGANVVLHPDFGTVWNGMDLGIPFDIVDNNTPLVPINFNRGAGDESDLNDTTACDTSGGQYVGCYPIPTNPSIEGGTDNHIILLNKDTCILYEVFETSGSAGNWSGFSGAIWDLGKNEVREINVTSADAAGLAILPGLIRYDEVFGPGEINHALRITMQDLQAAFIWPANHSDGTGANDPDKPPMGLRMRLKADYDISGFDAPIQKVMRALKKYGVIIADTGGQMFISGDHDMNWDDNQLKQLESLTTSNFEVVETNPPTPQEVYPYPCYDSYCTANWPLLY